MEEHKSIDELVIRVDERNIDESISELIGVSIDKCFIKSVANVNGTDLSKYKIIRKDDFAVSLMQVSRDGKIPVARMIEYDVAIMSPAYPIFRVKDKNIILPAYLAAYLYFTLIQSQAAISRLSNGGAQDNLNKNFIDNIKIVVPPSGFIEKLNLATIIKQMTLNTKEMVLLEELQSTVLAQLLSR